MTHPPFNDQPLMSTSDLEDQVAVASMEELRRSLRIVLGMSGAFWERDFDSGMVWYSPTFFRVLGLPDNTLEREQINARIHPDDRATFKNAYEGALAQGGPFLYDVRFLDATGEYRWARATGRVWVQPDGRPKRLMGMMSDVHVEREAQLAAQQSQALYQRALNASTQAHFERTVGRNDFTTSANLVELLGHPRGTPPPSDRQFTSWVHPDDAHIFREAIVKASSGEGPWEAICRLRQFDGSYRWFRGLGRTYRAEDGQLRMTGMLGDVHQQELDRQELEQHRQNLAKLVAERTASLDAALKEAQLQRSQAEEANRAKSEFLGHMSHELRTPLNGMLGMTELALRVSSDPAQRRYLEVALNAGQSLLRLINDVLDHARSENQTVQLEDTTYDLADLLTSVMRSLMPTIRPKGLGIRFDWQGDEHSLLRGDALRVRQVVINLLGNACKFTQHGYVALRASVEPTADGRAIAAVCIEDTGPGVDALRQQAIFDPFVQGDASLTRGHGGAGLGLAISRRLARAMGGDVTLVATGPTGSQFEFRWPVTLHPNPPPTPQHGPGHAWLLSERVEAGQWLQKRLARVGWTSDIKSGVATAVSDAAVPHTPPQLVLVAEQVMREPSDLRALRAALPHAHIVLAVRADWNQPPLEAAARRHGMPLAVVPLTLRDLRSLLHAASPADVFNSAPPEAPPAPKRPVILVVEDNAVNRMVVETMLAELGTEVYCAEDGQQAIALCETAAPDIVLMDLQMPVMDGLEATRRLRQWQREGRLPRFPILALTAHASDADRAHALAAGMDDYLTKPLQLPALEAALRRWMPAAPISTVNATADQLSRS